MAEGGKGEKEEINEMRRVEKEVMNAMEWKRIDAKEPRETGSAGGGVTWKAESGAQGSKAEIGSSRESGVGVKWERWVEMSKTQKSPIDNFAERPKWEFSQIVDDFARNGKF